MINELALIDTETSGLDETKDHILEVAVILFNVPHASVVDAFSMLIKHDIDPKCEALAINGIKHELLVDAHSPDYVWDHFADVCGTADAFVAHNEEFDRKFVTAIRPEFAKSKPWICSMDGIEWPKPFGSAALTSICLAHGVPVTSAHRALSDVQLIASLLQRVAETYDLQPILAKALRPRVKVIALVPYPEKEKAKSLRFRWDDKARKWTKTMFEDDLVNLPFKYEVMKTP